MRMYTYRVHSYIVCGSTKHIYISRMENKRLNMLMRRTDGQNIYIGTLRACVLRVRMCLCVCIYMNFNNIPCAHIQMKWWTASCQDIEHNSKHIVFVFVYIYKKIEYARMYLFDSNINIRIYILYTNIYLRTDVPDRLMYISSIYISQYININTQHTYIFIFYIRWIDEEYNEDEKYRIQNNKNN